MIDKLFVMQVCGRSIPPEIPSRPWDGDRKTEAQRLEISPPFSRPEPSAQITTRKDFRFGLRWL